jgi:predicted porin
MQKKLIAVAVAGLVSGAAFAQSNVTISGVADAYYGRLSGTGYKSYNAVNSGGLSGSRIAFNGAEDLGNGLKAIFQMEQAFDLTDGGGFGSTNSTRQSYVGLAGSFGAVVAGRLQTPGYYVGKFDALASAAISPQAILAKGLMIGGAVASTIAPSNNGRLNSAAAYLSPNFGGFSAVVAGSTSNYISEDATVTDTATDQGAWALGLNYAIGPVAVGFVHHNIQNFAVSGANPGAATADAKENMFGASYNAGFLTVLGSYQDAKLKDADKNKLYQVGVVVPVGAGNIHFAYGKLDMKLDTMDAKSMTVAYTHGLSKRTTAYAGYNKTDNKDGQSLGLTNVNIATGSSSSAKGLVVGLRHTF